MFFRFRENRGHMLVVACHVDLCFQARKQHTQSNETQLAPYPTLEGVINTVAPHMQFTTCVAYKCRVGC